MSSSNVIISKRLVDPADPLLDLVEKTYNDSFPKEERRDFSLIRTFIGPDSIFEMCGLFKNDVYVGFITAWHLDGFVYVEHFAIDAANRNGGIGAAGMKSFLSEQKMPVILEVELPTDSLSKRRIGFYERLGFVLDTHVYIQPKYHPEDEALELRLMTYGPIDLTHRFEFVKDQIAEKAYGCK